MAKVRNVNLVVGHGPEGEFAEVSYDVEFNRTELALNMGFYELIALMERDEGLDTYFPGFPASVLQYPSGNLDDNIGTVFKGPDVMHPDGESVVHRRHRRDWRFPNNESGPEEYRALVIVRPELWEGAAWSNEVSVNLK
jgi:hypothetical protein